MRYANLKSMNLILTLGILLAPAIAVRPAMANGYGEDGSWQFETSADMANMAAEETMIQEKQGGEFQKTTNTYNYNTTTNNLTPIQNQTNCTIESTATGNAGDNTEGGNTSESSGAQANATGNSSSNSLAGDGTYSSGALANEPTNSGTVSSSAAQDSTGSSSSGSVSEELNSTQADNASQTSSQSADTACKVSGSGSLN